MKNRIGLLLFLISSSVISQITDQKTTFLTNSLIDRNEKLNFTSNTLDKIRNQFRFDNSKFEIKL